MNKAKSIGIAAFSCLFSVCVTVGRHISFSGDVVSKITENNISSLSAVDALIFLCVMAAAFCAIMLLDRYWVQVEALCLCSGGRCQPVRFACLAAVLLLLAWLPHILSVAPGNIYGDSLSSIGQMLESGHPTSNHHPMFYTLLVGVFLKAGSVLFGSNNAGVLLFSLFQTASLIACMVLVLTILYRHRLHPCLLAASLAFFMFMPFFPSYAMTMWKDVPYSCMLLLLCVLLYALTQRESVGLWWTVCYALAGIGTMMMRNNGVYVFAAASAVALWIERRHVRRLLAASVAALAVFITLFSGAAYLWSVQEDFAENLGIPLQQLGYCLNNGGSFSEEEEEYLYALMPEEVWHYAYRPCLVDTIKWNPQFDYAFLLETREEFFRVWLGGLLRNPAMYVRAYCLATFGFWKPGVQNLYGYMDVQLEENPYGIERMDLFEQLFGFSLLPFFSDYPVILGSGTLLWLVLWGCVLAVMRSREGLAPYLPALMNWATVMIATPVAFSLRYVFIFALGLPLFMALPLMTAAGRGEEGISALDRNGIIAYNASIQARTGKAERCLPQRERGHG